MSHSVTLTFALGLLSFARASLDSRGLVETNATCQENFEWAFSKQDLSPCFLLAAVSAPCYQGEFFAKALLPGNHYDPPLKAKGTVNQCSCSWAAYNLMMACTTCQGQTSSVSTWPSYRAECGDLISNTTYWPSDIMIASNQTIPFYAGQNPDQWMGQSFNVPEAKLITAENNPDLTGAPSQKKTTSIGAIVGGTVGGVLLLVLVSLLLFYTCRRRRASRTLQGISSRGLGYFALPGSPPFSTSTTPTMHTFSRLSTPSMYAFSVAQTPPLHQHYSMVGSPSITQIVRPEPPTSHIEPFMLTSPGESPETVACRRKKAPARGAPQSRSQTVPTTAVVSPGQQTTPGHVHRLQGVEEAEDGPQPRVPRGRSESQPPAYDSLLLETIEVAAALRERSGHSHRPHGASPENGSQDSQTSWVSFGGVSGSTNSPPVSIVVRGQQPRNVDELLAPRAGPSCDTRYRSVQSSANGDHPDVEVA